MPNLYRLAIFAALTLSFAISFIVLESATRPASPPSFAQTRDRYRSSEATLLDRHGEILQTLRVDLRARRLEWTPLSRISPALQHRVVDAEDRRFATHHGVDWLAVAAATRDRLRGGLRRGASTIAMQLAAQLDPSLAPTRGRRGVLLKIRQMRAALQLGAQWSNDQLLEAYLNGAGYRGELQGVAAASMGLFGKHPDGLTDAEALTLVALLPAPSAMPQAVAQRACRLAHADAIACEAQRALTLAALSRPAANTNADLAPQLAHRLLLRAGERIGSTIDARIQRLALAALRGQLASLRSEQVRDGAAVVVDNASGDVLAYVGSAGPASRAAQVDGARALRQAGSTLKPFLYSMAIERRWLTAASLLDDAPVALEAGPGLYLPQNYEHDFKGLVSVRSALASSLNIPAVRTLLLAGIENFRERLHALGYVQGLTESGNYYGYSLALGSAEVSLLEQVNAYRTLANGGRWSPLRLRADDAIEAPRQIISEAAAWIVSDILADRSARALSFDLEGPLSTPYRASVKTGTSKNLRDNWCIGYTPRYTVGVWVGNFEGDPMRTVSGITGAAPAWREILDALEAEASSLPATPPAGLVHQALRYANAIEPPRQEWFVDGTQTALVTVATPIAARARLVSPANGSLIALDPDIPLTRQHLVLRAEPASAQLRLLLDRRDVGNAAQSRLWLPVPGQHHLELVDAGGARLDEVAFSVRQPR